MKKNLKRELFYAETFKTKLVNTGMFKNRTFKTFEIKLVNA